MCYFLCEIFWDFLRIFELVSMISKSEDPLYQDTKDNIIFSLRSPICVIQALRNKRKLIFRT